MPVIAERADGRYNSILAPCRSAPAKLNEAPASIYDKSTGSHLSGALPSVSVEGSNDRLNNRYAICGESDFGTLLSFGRLLAKVFK